MRRTFLLLIAAIFVFMSAQPARAFRPELFVDLADYIPELSGSVFDAETRMLYTIPDSGNGPFLGFTDIDTRETVVKSVIGAENVDWEALAFDPAGYLWICDVGDNSARREQVRLYQVAPRRYADEPNLPFERSIDVIYPGGPMDVEAAVYQHETLYLFEKVLITSAPARVMTVDVSENASAFQVAETVGLLKLPFAITDAALDSRGRLYLLTYCGLYINPRGPEFFWPILPVRLFHFGQQEALTLLSDCKFLVGIEAGPVYSFRLPLRCLR